MYDLYASEEEEKACVSHNINSNENKCNDDVSYHLIYCSLHVERTSALLQTLYDVSHLILLQSP